MASAVIQSLGLESPKPELLVSQGRLKELKNLVLAGIVDVRGWKDSYDSSSLLHVAASSNQVEMIQYLTSGYYPLNINAQNKDGNTPLHIAVIQCHREAVAALLKLKADDTILNHSLDPALHIALRQGSKSLDLVKDFLLIPNVNIFVTGRHRQSTLHVVAQLDDVEMLKVFHDVACDRGVKADMVARDSNGVSIIHVAAKAGALQVMSFLFKVSNEYGQLPEDLSNMATYTGRVPLHHAVESNHIECVRLLLTHGADCTIQSGRLHPPIHLAASQDTLEILKLMVELKGVSVLQVRDRLGGTLLHSSVSSINSKEIIPFLVSNGVEVSVADQNGLTALMNAIHLGSVMATESLLNCGADPLIMDSQGRNSLHLVVLGKRIKLCSTIMQAAAVDEMKQTPDKSHMLPIHYALKLGLSCLVEALLLEKNIKDDEGNNYVHFAALSGDTETLLKTLDLPNAQSMINEANHDGFTPLHFAAKGSAIAIIRQLIDYGAIIHKSNSGLTPFMLACHAGNLEAAELLFSTNQFQRHWVDLEENSPLHWAVDGGNPHIITYCLDQDIPVTLNSDGFSFFDKILCRAEETASLAQAAILHKRWEECIDIVSGGLPHPLLRILDTIPEVYGTLLDQCLSKSTHDSSHEGYWEEFNFKGVTISPTLGYNQLDSGSRISIETDNPDKSSSALHATDIGLNEVEMIRIRQNSQREQSISAKTARLPKIQNKPIKNSLVVVHELIKKKKEQYLLHPVVEAFIQTKWSGFGKYFYFTRFAIHVLLALFLSVLVSVIPLPLQQQQLQNYTNAFDNETCCAPEISLVGFVLLSITLALTILNILVFGVEAYSHRLDLFKYLSQHIVIFLSFAESVCTITFLLSIAIGGLESALWHAVAIAICLAWLSVGFQMQLIRIFNIGVYITIFMSTSRLVFKVLVIMFFFILAFALPLHVLVGSQSELQFTTPGISIFAMIHTLIAVTDYLGFIRLEQENQLRFSTLIFLFLAVIIVMLPIVIVNILIGLAVGDIARIQQEAVITRRTVEVRALAPLDYLSYPKWLTRKMFKKHHRHYPNRCGRVKKFLTFLASKLTDKHMDSSLIDSSEESAAVRREIAKEHETIENRFKKLEKRMDQQLEGLRRLDDQLDNIKSSKDALAGIERLESMIAELIKTRKTVM